MGIAAIAPFLACWLALFWPSTAAHASSGSAQLKLQSGQQLLSAGDFSSAARDFRDAAASDPTNAFAH